MTEPEIQAWLHQLAPSNKTRMTRLRELIRYAKWDGMSREDLEICKRCLRELEADGVDREGPA